MPDQAEVLRDRIRSAAEPADSHSSARAHICHTLLLTGGKGGVGASQLSLNLAVALGQAGQRVALLDADWSAASLGLLSGVMPRWNLADALEGRCSLADVAIPVPHAGELCLFANAHPTRSNPGASSKGPEWLSEELPSLKEEIDFLVIDGGPGISEGLPELARLAEETVVVTTPEPSDLACAQGLLARLQLQPASGDPSSPRLRAIVNQAASLHEAQDAMARLCQGSHEFWGVLVAPMGLLRWDQRPGQAARQRCPLLVRYPRSPLSRAIRRMALGLLKERGIQRHRERTARSFADPSALSTVGFSLLRTQAFWVGQNQLFGF